MAFPVSPVCAKLSILLLSALFVSSVLSRGIDEQFAKCRHCWEELERTLSTITHHYDVTDSEAEDILQAYRPKSDVLFQLLTGKGRQSLRDQGCFACWVVLLRLSTETRQGLGSIEEHNDDNTFSSFNKRVMLNNGWV